MNASPPPAVADRMPAAHALAIDAIAVRSLAEQQTPAASIAVVSSGRIVFARGYGLRDVRARLPADAATRYGIGSITKTIVAALILKLSEDGRLALGDRAARWLPELGAFPNVTLRELLEQRSGIRDYNDAEFIASLPLAFAPGRVDREAIVRKLGRSPPRFSPGSRFEYSNANYLLLGIVAERATGETLPALLRRRIFAPVGMRDTELDDAAGADDATGYTKGPFGPLAVRQWDWRLTYSTGGIRSTAIDIARFDAALCEGRVVSPASLRLMDAAPERVGPQSRYALGFWAYDGATGRVLWHDGTVIGFKAMNMMWPRTCDALVVLANADYFHAPAVAARAAQAAFGGEGPADEPFDPNLPRWSEAIGLALATVVVASALLRRRRYAIAIAGAALTYAAAAIWLPAGFAAVCVVLAGVAWSARHASPVRTADVRSSTPSG